jgi:two-component sensor histidine kinase
MNVLPFLRIVTEVGFQSPRLDLAPVIRHVCETYWKEAGGKEERLNLHLGPQILDLDRIRWLSEAVRALLAGGLSPGFSPEVDGALGVHLWSVNGTQQIVLLIADSGKEINDEPSTPFITSARQYAERAGCSLIREHARGAVWRIHIPENDVQSRLYTARGTQSGG